MAEGAYLNGETQKKNWMTDPNAVTYDGSTIDAKENAALADLYEIAQKNQNALYNKYIEAQDMYDLSNQQIRNLAAQERKEAQANSDDEWFEAQSSFQQAVDTSKKNAGGALTGSLFLDFLDTLENYDNKIDSNTRTNLRKNFNEINKDEYESLAANINALNELGVDTEYALRQLANDYLAQRVNINPDKAHGQEWEDWSHVGDNFYNEHKYNPDASWYGTQQDLLLEGNAQKKANELTNQARANTAGASNNYFNDLLSSRNRRY